MSRELSYMLTLDRLLSPADVEEIHRYGEACIEHGVAQEKARVALLMAQGSGDGLEDGTFTLPASVAREIVGT